MRLKRFPGIALLFLGITVVPVTRAQDVEPPPAAARSGLRILDLSGYAVYYSSSLPGSGYQPGAAQLLSDVGGGASARLAWMKFTEHSAFSLIYTPSFTGRKRYSEWNALNHAVSLSVSSRLAPQWNVSFSVNGDYSSLDQFLFSPTAYSAAVSAPGQFDDLASAVLASRFNSPQLTSIFTSAPTAQSPMRNLLYGQRMFTAGAQASLSYSYSPRVSFTFTGGGGRSQHVQDDRVVTSGSGYLLADTTSGSASAAFNYAVSPLTQIGGSVTTTRVASTLYDGYNTVSIATLGRTLGRRWLLQGRGGVGITNPVRQPLAGRVSTSPHPVAGGSLGYRTFAHAFLGSFDRTVSDSYGTGASISASANGTWRWNRPGSTWSLEAGGGWEQLQGVSNTSGWRTNVGLGRRVGAHTTLLTQYVYLNYSGRSNGSSYNLGQSAVRFSVVWTPRPGTSR